MIYCKLRQTNQTDILLIPKVWDCELIRGHFKNNEGKEVTVKGFFCTLMDMTVFNPNLVGLFMGSF